MRRNRFLFLIVFGWAPVTFALSLKFADYPVDRVYKGDIVLPQFKGRDKNWRNFRTRITESMTDDGVEYAGEINVVQIGCGTSCSFITLANVKTGHLYDFPRSGEEIRSIQIHVEPTSKLLAAQWEGNDGCHLEHYLWIGKGVKRLNDRQLASAASCMNLIKDNLP
jgi:hypothetical protein